MSVAWGFSRSVAPDLENVVIRYFLDRRGREPGRRERQGTLNSLN